MDTENTKARNVLKTKQRYNLKLIKEKYERSR